MENIVWGLFVADSKRGFPNFFPIGIYSSQELAEKELRHLPKGEHYQLFELPINHLLGKVKGDQMLNGMGKFPHEHFIAEIE